MSKSEPGPYDDLYGIIRQQRDWINVLRDERALLLDLERAARDAIKWDDAACNAALAYTITALDAFRNEKK